MPVDDKTENMTDDESESSLDESDDDIEIFFDDEERHPPEYYLTRAAKLDVTRLRQKRCNSRLRKPLIGLRNIAYSI